MNVAKSLVIGHRYATRKPNEVGRKVVFVRHGESVFNKKNLFCGWYDARLSEKGLAEARAAGQQLKKANFVFRKAFVSELSRAQQTLCAIIAELEQNEEMEIVKHWRLNERHYGNLSGYNKAEAAAKFSKEQVHKWRRDFRTRPPTIERDNALFSAIQDGKKYGLPDNQVPLGESLKDTSDRTLVYWTQTILPELKHNGVVLIVAHGNSLRAIVKHIDRISDEGIQYLNLPTGIPFLYLIGDDGFAVGDVEWFGDQKRVEDAKADLKKAKSVESGDQNCSEM